MSRPVLPLTALRAFEAVMRLGRMAAAAEELGVTHGAVSRQIGALQVRLGARLFQGPRNARTPTPEARALHDEIAPAFDILARAMARRAPPEALLRISCLSTLAARWLIPRLPRFAETEPAVMVELTESYAAPERLAGGADMAIRMLGAGQPPPPGLAATAFMANPVGMVMRPGDDARRARRLASRSHPAAWKDWRARGGGGVDARPPLLFDHQQTMIEATLAGLGVCVTQRPLVERELAAGRLAAPMGFQDDGACFVVLHAPQASSRAARGFMAWLLDEGAASAPLTAGR